MMLLLATQKSGCLVQEDFSIETSIISCEYFPSGKAHEAGGREFSILGHLAHTGARDEFEIILVLAGAAKEFHSLFDLIVCCYLKGENIDTL